MKVVVLGAGAMGCLFGGLLKASGNDVLLVDVWREHVDAINAKGLLIDRNGEEQLVRVRACLPRDVDESCELLLVFTKSFHTRTALESVAAILDDKVQVMTLQNGVGHVDVIQDFVGKDRIIHGITTYPCDLAGPGKIETKGSGYIKMMSVDGVERSELTAIHGMFEKSGFDCRLRLEVTVDIWEKLAFNSALNPFSALLRMPVGAISASVQGRQLAHDIAGEVVNVALALGIRVDRERIMGTVDMALEEHRHHQPSMLQDIMKKRQTEIAFINGAVIDAARSCNVPVPANEMLYRLMVSLEQAVMQGIG